MSCLVLRLHYQVIRDYNFAKIFFPSRKETLPCCRPAQSVNQEMLTSRLRVVNVMPSCRNSPQLGIV